MVKYNSIDQKFPSKTAYSIGLNEETENYNLQFIGCYTFKLVNKQTRRIFIMAN